MPSASFMSKLSLQHLDNSLLSGSLRTLFRGSQTQYRVARELYGSILLLFPHRVPSHQSSSDGNPRFICLLIAGSPCIGIRLAKFFSDGFTSQNTQFSPFNCNRTLYTRIGFSGPIEVSVLGGPLYR